MYAVNLIDDVVIVAIYVEEHSKQTIIDLGSCQTRRNRRLCYPRMQTCLHDTIRTTSPPVSLLTVPVAQVVHKVELPSSDLNCPAGQESIR